MTHNPTLGHIYEKDKTSNSKRYMNHNIHSTTTYNSQDMEATCVHQQMNG